MLYVFGGHWGILLQGWRPIGLGRAGQAAEVLSVWALVLQEFGAGLRPGKSFCISYVIIELRECLSPGE